MERSKRIKKGENKGELITLCSKVPFAQGDTPGTPTALNGGHKMADFKKMDYQTTIKVMRHNFRENKSYRNKNVDLERTKENITGLTTNYKDTLSRFQDTGKELPHPNRKDAVAAIGYVIQLPETCETDKEIKTFYSIAASQLIAKFGKERILGIGIHNDENRPHLHALVIPIIEDEKGKRIKGKDFLTRALLKTGHKDLQKVIDKNKILGPACKVYNVGDGHDQARYENERALQTR